MRTNRRTKIFILFFILFVVSILTNYVYAANNDLKLYSDSAVIIENKTGKILYEKNSEQKMYPASTTKILTAILTIERGNLQDKTKVSKAAIADMKSGYTSAYLVEGEELTVEELLELLLIHSANDASNVLAEYISGSIPAFVDLMNLKLKELGCSHSHFVTTNGLHDDNHYTTAKDMATITRYCMKNADFRRIVAMQECHIKATNKFGERLFKNTNDLEVAGSKYYYPGCIGVKTGFTSQAQNCLISAVNKNNLQLIAVVLHCNLTDDKKSARYVDSKTLYDYAYANYSFLEIAKASSFLKTIEVKGGSIETKNLDLKLQDNIVALVKKDSLQKVIPEIKLNDNISAPIAQNAILGQATYTVDGQTYSTNLLASHNVEKDESTIFFLRLALGIVIFSLFIILVIILFKSLKKNANKKNIQELELKTENEKQDEMIETEKEEPKNQIVKEIKEEQHQKQNENEISNVNENEFESEKEIKIESEKISKNIELEENLVEQKSKE